jgi:hypothetical protein
MRTTITLDDDLAVRLERRRAERGMTFKDVVNDAVRAGLAALEARPGTEGRETATTRPLPLGRRLVDDLDDVADVLAVAEGEDFR